MSNLSKLIMTTIATVTVAAIVTWQATGGDWYTKYEVVEQVQIQLDEDDPLAAAGFYDEGTTTKTVTKDEFRFGLLPTPAGIFDKHALSVASVTGPLWAFGLGVVWYQRRRRSVRRRT